MSKPEQPIVLYHYAYSPFARRVVWYLQLRGIPYIQCLQPPTMPRQDLARLGISYRRIPVMSIGRDVYLDTRLILRKLEALPGTGLPPLSSSHPATKGIEATLESLVVDGGVFTNAALLIPADLPLLKDPKFREDRADFRGGSPLTGSELRSLRPEALTELRCMFKLLETTFLADGRTWLLDTEGPTMADLEAVWPLVWMARLPGALPAEVISAEKFPRVYAWMERFEKTAKEAGSRMGKAKTVSGEEAEKIIREAAYHEADVRIESSDPVGQLHRLKQGSEVTVWPIDSGSAHKDTGKLVGLDADEVVIELGGTEGGSKPARIHAPRHGFRVRPAAEAGPKI